MAVLRERFRLSSGAGPADAYLAGPGARRRCIAALHDQHEAFVDVRHAEDAIHQPTIFRCLLLQVRDLGGTGRDEEDADVFVLQFRVFLLRQRAGQFCRHIHRRVERQDIVHKVRIANRDEPSDHGTGRADDRFRNVFPHDVAAGISGDQFGCLRHFENVIEADLQEAVQYIVDVIEMVELPIECRGGQRDLEFVILNAFEGVALGVFCLIPAGPDAFAAVHATLTHNGCLAVADADGLNGATLGAGGAADAFIHREKYRMLVCIFPTSFKF